MRYKQCFDDPVQKNKENSAAASILDAASQLFLEKGYTAVTMREIARTAGVNLGLLSYYYGSKEKLAEVVFQRVKDKAFYDARSVDLEMLGSAERLYVQTILGQKSIRKNWSEAARRFYFEYMSATRGNYYVSDSFEKMSWEVIREYNRKVTLSQNEGYLTAVAGAEQMLMLRSINNEIHMTDEDILDLVISNYFYNIGLNDESIASIISRGKCFLEKVDFGEYKAGEH